MKLTNNFVEDFKMVSTVCWYVIFFSCIAFSIGGITIQLGLNIDNYFVQLALGYVIIIVSLFLINFIIIAIEKFKQFKKYALED